MAVFNRKVQQPSNDGLFSRARRRRTISREMDESELRPDSIEIHRCGMFHSARGG